LVTSRCPSSGDKAGAEVEPMGVEALDLLNAMHSLVVATVRDCA
jgi:hypothetical protein